MGNSEFPIWLTFWYIVRLFCLRHNEFVTRRREGRMKPMLRLIAVWVLAAPLVWSQTIAIRAGRLFDPKSGTNLSNQVVLIRGERIMDVGPAASVQVPAGAQVIDLSNATVLP